MYDIKIHCAIIFRISPLWQEICFVQNPLCFSDLRSTPARLEVLVRYGEELDTEPALRVRWAANLLQ